MKLTSNGNDFGNVVISIWTIELKPDADHLPGIAGGAGSPRWRQPFHIAVEVDREPLTAPAVTATAGRFPNPNSQWQFQYDVDGNGQIASDEVVYLITTAKKSPGKSPEL